MAVGSESGNKLVNLWILLHRTRDILLQCEESIFGQYGLTPEQFGVLANLKGHGGSLRPVDLALLLERSPNSVSNLVDRMVKAGLVRRARERKDRRTVRVSLTSEGENAIVRATPAGWELIQKILSPLSDEDRDALASILETVKCEAFACVHPELDRTEITKRSVTNQPDSYQLMVKNIFHSGSEAKRRGGKKRL
jgi:DNA-binding MarR family transcriptional regulator